MEGVLGGPCPPPIFCQTKSYGMLVFDWTFKYLDNSLLTTDTVVLAIVWWVSKTKSTSECAFFHIEDNAFAKLRLRKRVPYFKDINKDKNWLIKKVRTVKHFWRSNVGFLCVIGKYLDAHAYCWLTFSCRKIIIDNSTQIQLSYVHLNNFCVLDIACFLSKNDN